MCCNLILGLVHLVLFEVLCIGKFWVDGFISRSDDLITRLEKGNPNPNLIVRFFEISEIGV